MSMTPEGDYMAELVTQDTDEGPMACVLGEAKTGTKQVALAVKIVEGEFAGRVRTWIGFFTPDTLDSTLDQLRNAGFKGDDLAEFPNQRPAGRFPIKIAHETDKEGKVRERVRWINNPSRGAGGFKMEKTMTVDQRRLFSAQFTARLKAKPEVVTPAPSVTNGASGKPASDPQI